MSDAMHEWTEQKQKEEEARPIRRLQKRVADLEAQLKQTQEELEVFGRHDSDCRIYLRSGEESCDCGWNEVKQALADKETGCTCRSGFMGDHGSDCPVKLKDLLAKILAVGHNDDCLFCGLKDKLVLQGKEGP